MGIIIYCVILAVVLIGFGGFSVKHIINTVDKQFQYYMNVFKKDTNVYQFCEDFKKYTTKNGTKFPIINMKIGDKKCVFLLDTGADTNILDKSMFDIINDKNQYKLLPSDGIIFGNGLSLTPGVTHLNFSYKTIKFEQDFEVVDMHEAFDSIKKDTTIKLNGILGDKFFQEYQWIIDFEKLVIWVK